MASLEGSGGETISTVNKPCMTCRRRKIKCDKTRPCSNCVRSKQHCSYDGDDPSFGTVQRSNEASPSTDSEVRERLARLEKLMERVLVGEPDSRATTSSPELATSTSNLKGTLNHPASPPTTSPVPSQSFQADISSAIETASSPVGQILFQELHSAYFDSDFWAGLVTEIEDLRHLFDGSCESSPSSWVSNSILGVPSPFSSADSSPAHPTLEESNLLCQLFFESVNPFIRVLHQAHFGRELDRYRRGSLLTPREFEALLFSVYTLTVSSLRPQVVERVFSVPKEVLLARYQYSAQAALSNVNFFKTDKVHTLQALTHYVTFLFQQNLYQDANALLGIAARLAQTTGLHRDPSHFPFSPWVCEIRRRSWNHLCCLDAMALTSYGTESCLPATTDARPPQNANDSDWHASRFANPSSVPSNFGITDMTFALVHRDMADMIRNLAIVNPLDFEMKESILHQTETCLKENYLRGFDRSNPAHTIVAALIDTRLASIRLSLRHRQTEKVKSQASEDGRHQVFVAAIELLEALEYHSQSFASFNWEWVFETTIPWLAIAIAITELPRAIRPDDIDRASRQIERNFQRYSNPSMPVSSTPMWKLLVELRQHMQETPGHTPPGQNNAALPTSQPLQGTVPMAFTDDLMLDFRVPAAGTTDSLMYEDQFMLQDMQDLPWLNTKMPY